MRSHPDAELPVPPIERGRILQYRFAVHERRRYTLPGVMNPNCCQTDSCQSVVTGLGGKSAHKHGLFPFGSAVEVPLSENSR
jgi:hypothetical protein